MFELISVSREPPEYIVSKSIGEKMNNIYITIVETYTDNLFVFCNLSEANLMFIQG